jgi:hypothetical protein
VLDQLTTPNGFVIVFNMKATLLIRDRIVLSESAFAELVLWQVPKPVSGSSHSFKYRLAYIVNGFCVCGTTMKQARVITVILMMWSVILRLRIRQT